MTDYLRLQIAAGAQAVQIFDSWAGLLGGPRNTSGSPCRSVRRIVEGVRGPRRAGDLLRQRRAALLEAAATAGSDVLGLCWRTPLDDAPRARGPERGAAGQPRPARLFATPDDGAAAGRARAGPDGGPAGPHHEPRPRHPARHADRERGGAGGGGAGYGERAAAAARARHARANAAITADDSELLARYDGPGPRYTSYPTAVEFHEGFDQADYARASRAADARRRAALALRAPAVLRGALHLLRLQRRHHEAPRRRGRATSTTSIARSICWRRTCRTAAGLADALGRRHADLLPRPSRSSACSTRIAQTLHLHARRRGRRRGRSARHHGASRSRRCAALRLQPPLDGRAGLRARGAGGGQPHPELRADARRWSSTRATLGYRLDQHRPDLRPAVPDASRASPARSSR